MNDRNAVRKSLTLGLLCVAALAPLVEFAAEAQSPDLNGDSIIQHLNQTIAWYGHITSEDQSGTFPQNVVLQDNVRQSSAQAVQKAFAFAQAEAALLVKQKTKANAAPGKRDASTANLAQVADQANQRIAKLQSQIDDLNQQIAKTSKRKQLATLNSQKAALAADLDFARMTQASLKEMLSFSNTTESAGGLVGQINLLASSANISAALANNFPAASTRPAASNVSAFHPETAGIFGLLSNTFSLLRIRSDIGSLISDTGNLHTATLALAAPLRAKTKSLVLQSDALARATAGETDPVKLNAARQELQSMTAQFKALSGPTLYLIEQGIALHNTANGLAQWNDVIGSQLHTSLGYLAFRLGTVLAAIALLLIISEVVRRATFRYIHETRRRRQIVLMRRVIVASVTTLIAVLASVSGIGSFATMAGFVTAGLAVALQNIILSVVAYFFLIGRYGLRTGDHVTVTNLTGKVIEVGLVRFYLMELAGTGSDMHATGRVAVFSNSVIFQPAALIKQAPGTEYAWHSVSVTLAGDPVLEDVRKRVTGAVDEVYTKYRRAIEQQQEIFEKTANIQLANLAPVSRARYTDQGVEVLVRYPVELSEMSEVDEEVILAVMHETQKAPALQLAAGGFPKVITAT
ncbi:MAG TPA: mechanosensitive ion channel family protein [Bryobacteraceae bacterium]|nr:mechanosensitive ion channel family protein [Bryobacteraceae bacterium]